MSGPSSTQLNLQNEQMQFYQEGMDQSRATFGEQQSLLKQMEAVYEPILARGPNVNAFAGEEEAALNSEAIDSTARNYSMASRAVGERMAAQGGGDNPLPSGVEEQVRGEIASSAAGELSREQEQILEAGYTQGEKEFEHAGAGLAEASGQLNPVAFEQAATGAGSAAESTAKDINAEQNSWLAPVLGAVGGLGGGLLGNPGLFGKKGGG